MFGRVVKSKVAARGRALALVLLFAGMGGVGFGVAGCSEQREPVGALPTDIERALRAGAAAAAAERGGTTPRTGSGAVTSDPDLAARVDSHGRLHVGGLAWTTPSGWIPEAPARGDFADWKYRLRGSSEGQEAALTMGTVGGTVEQNIARWKQQLGQNRRNETQRDLGHDHVPATFFHSTGTFDGRPDLMLAGVLLEYRESAEAPPLVYVRVLGPEATVREHLARLEAFGRQAMPLSHLGPDSHDAEPAQQDDQQDY